MEEDRRGAEKSIHAPLPFLRLSTFPSAILVLLYNPHRILANTLHVFFTTPSSLASICERHKRVTRSNFHDRAREWREYQRSEDESIRRDERAEVVPCEIRHATGNRQREPLQQSTIEREREKMEFVPNLFNCKLNSRVTKRIQIK